ncbi:MAG TPA: hypothetical protein VFW28_02605 [Micropepsaceae bacterium]|nr:hypothetical protein [Micropepsaceae bacterium]
MKDWSVEQRSYRDAIRSIWIGDFVWKKDGSPDFGVRAQQAHTHFRHAIREPTRNGEIWQADYGKFAPLALWGVKDLYCELESLRSELAQLAAQIAELIAAQI